MIELINGSEFPDKVIPLIDNAKESIFIINYDWRWYPNDPACEVQLFNQSFVRALNRGVGVFAVLHHANIVNTLKQLGASAKTLATSRLVHAKIILIDENILIIGSHNLTQYAFTKNFELSVIIKDDFDFKQILKYFDNLWTQ